MEDLAMTGPTAELHSAGKIGAYLGCDPALLDQALARQQQWAAQRTPQKAWRTSPGIAAHER